MKRQDFKVKKAERCGFVPYIKKKSLTQPERQGYNCEMNKIITYNLREKKREPFKCFAWFFQYLFSFSS